MRGGLMQPPAGMEDPSAQPVESDTMGMEGGPDDYFGGAEQATPEEQAIYEMAMDAVWGMLYSEEEATDSVVTALADAKGDLNATGVKAGQLGLGIMQNLDAQFQEQQQVIPESVRMELGIEIIDEILSMAEAAHMIPTDDASLEQVITVAIDEMASKYGRGMAESGMINPQASQALLGEMRNVAGSRLGMPPGGGQNPMAQGVQDAGGQMT